MYNSKDNHHNDRRIILTTLFSLALLGTGLFLCHKVATSAYAYTEKVVVDEAKRVNDTNVTKIDLNITSSTTINDIAAQLSSAHIITDKNFFIAEACLYHQNKGFIPGTYAINSNMSSNAILDLITIPLEDDATVKFTIPEGYTVEQIGEVLEAQHIVSKSDFIKAVNNRNYATEYEFIQEIPGNEGYKYKLEGYLFPDTYIVRKDASAEEIVMKMLDRFNEIYGQYASYAHSTGYTTHELITIASIIEQEAKLDEERATISGVIYNRLMQNMNLQMCSTIQYSLNKRKSSLTYADIEKDSPYNTYSNKGLPIGPICNPGEACIKAALFPENNNYYYFVLKNSVTGQHDFSTTLEEHNQKKAAYKENADINFTN